MRPHPFQVDRLVTRAMLACVAAALLMLANRWIVAGQQAQAMAELLVENARAVAVHSLAEHVAPASGESPASRLDVHDIVAVSPHHLAAAMISPQAVVVSEARGGLHPGLLERLRSPAGAGAELQLNGQGGLEPISHWRWLPAVTALEIDADSGRTLRLLVSMDTPRRNQRYIFVQGVKSVVLALALVLSAVLLILRQPRRSLVEARRHAARLPFETPPALPEHQSGLADIDSLRASLNQVGGLLEQQRRQHAIDEQRLVQAAREARAAAEAKSTFLAHMSHEIRTPLTGVLGLTRLVLNTPLTQVQQQHLSTVHDSAKNLMLIVNEVLDLSRIEAGRLHLESVPFSLYALLDEACKPFALRAADKSIELVNEVCPNLPLTVIGDPMRLRQVLVNLLGNAIKFTHTGHVRLHVEGTAPSSTLAGSDAVTIAFHVSDTGPGIPEDKQARIFQAFVQADSATARQYGGSGLGLSITTRLLDLMKTQLRVASRVGEGSTFSFEVTLGLPPTPQAGHLTHYRHLPGQRVLWVSASGQAVPWYTSVFSLWGLTLEHARTLAEARQALKQQHYKTLFVDVGGEPAGARHATLMALVQDAGADRVCALFGPTDTLPPALEQPDTQPLVLMKPVSPQDLNRALIGERPQRASAAPLRLDGLTLLVVDDNEVNLLVARATLEGLGAVVQTAADGLSALHLLEASGADAAVEDGERNDFDAVLMDLNMPGIDGLETTRRWRRTESQRGTGRLPVVALTAADSNDDRQALLDAGLDGFVGKPIRSRQLVAELRSVITERAVRDAAQPAAASS